MSIVRAFILDIPPVTRSYIFGSVILTGLVSLNVCGDTEFFYNYSLIFHHGQIWRLFTSLIYFGPLSVYMAVILLVFSTYSIRLEEHSFRGKPSDFIYFLLVSSVCFLLLAPFLGFTQISYCFFSLVVYLWGRRNKNVQINVLFLIRIPAPYLACFANQGSFTIDLVGILVAHNYYYWEDVYPKLAISGGARPLKTPRMIEYLCEKLNIQDNEFEILAEEPEEEEPEAIVGGFAI